MAKNYVICVRSTKKVGGERVFGNEPGATLFLQVPAGESPNPSHKVQKKEWVTTLLKEAENDTNEVTGKPTGDILVFIHGYSNSPEVVIERHRTLEKDLGEQGYRGAVVSYDWPSAQSTLNYLEDRGDARKTALRLRDDCISLFSSRQQDGCEINVHLLAHSMGAYLVRQSFTYSDENSQIKNRPWTVSQIAFIGADLSSKSMRASSDRSTSLYRHCVRLTNYQNPHDSALKLSNTKRIGLSPRAGRVGLPIDAHEKAVNINCDPYFETLLESDTDRPKSFSHSWYIGDKVFAEDLCYTLQGNIDRHHIPTRESENGQLMLAVPGE